MKRLFLLLAAAASLTGALSQPSHAEEETSEMTIAVIGTGRVGGALGPRLAELGHRVVYGTREPQREDVQALVAATGDGTRAALPGEAAHAADWIVLATPHSAMPAVSEAIGDVSGKLIIDVTNALVPADDGLMKLADSGSAGEAWQAAKPDAKVVKAFSTVGYHVMADPAAAGGPVTTLLIGDDADAKATVASLAESLGFETMDVGPMRNARYLEGLAVLYLVPLLQGRGDDAFEIYLRQGTGTSNAVRVPE